MFRSGSYACGDTDNVRSKLVRRSASPDNFPLRVVNAYILISVRDNKLLACCIRVCKPLPAKLTCNLFQLEHKLQGPLYSACSPSFFYQPDAITHPASGSSI